MSPEVNTFLAVAIVSIISLTGIFTLFTNHENVKKFTLILVSLAAGTLIGDVFFHIIPELYEENEHTKSIPFFILSGLMLFFVLEKFLNWRHCHNEMDEAKNHRHPVAINNLVADGLHNFIDGMIIAASFLVSNEVGIATTIAVILHEIPQEIGDFGVLIHSGFDRAKALFFNFVSALLAVIGAILGLAIGDASEEYTFYLLAFAAGGFIYIATADLIPEIKHEVNLKKSILQLLIVLVGMGAMYGLTYVEPHDHGNDEDETIESEL